MPINELRAIATFGKAVELGSIRRAALAQGVTPQAASQALAQLEEHLGVRLLHRTTRSLALTEEGQRFLETTRPALAALDRALSQARESKDEIAGRDRRRACRASRFDFAQREALRRGRDRRAVSPSAGRNAPSAAQRCAGSP